MNPDIDMIPSQKAIRLLGQPKYSFRSDFTFDSSLKPLTDALFCFRAWNGRESWEGLVGVEERGRESRRTRKNGRTDENLRYEFGVSTGNN